MIHLIYFNRYTLIVLHICFLTSTIVPQGTWTLRWLISCLNPRSPLETKSAFQFRGVFTYQYFSQFPGGGGVFLRKKCREKSHCVFQISQVNLLCDPVSQSTLRKFGFSMDRKQEPSQMMVLAVSWAPHFLPHCLWLQSARAKIFLSRQQILPRFIVMSTLHAQVNYHVCEIAQTIAQLFERLKQENHPSAGGGGQPGQHWRREKKEKGERNKRRKKCFQGNSGIQAV